MTAAIVAGYLASFAILLRRSRDRLAPGAADPALVLVIALVAAAMGGKGRALTFVAVLFTAFAFVVGMAIAVATNHPLW